MQLIKKLRRMFSKKKSTTKPNSSSSTAAVSATIKPIPKTTLMNIPRSKSPVYLYNEAQDNIVVRKGTLKDFDVAKFNKIKFAVSKYPKLQIPVWSASRPYGQNAVHFRFRYRAKTFGGSSAMGKQLSQFSASKSYGRGSSQMGITEISSSSLLQFDISSSRYGKSRNIFTASSRRFKLSYSQFSNTSSHFHNHVVTEATSTPPIF